MDIARLIEFSFNEATKVLAMGTSPGALARARERAYVKSLIARLRSEFHAEDVRVFSISQRGNAADFGTEYLLYDIAVCRIGEGETAERKAEDYLYIAEALWQIEIDFSRDWRLALQAINRLNCGAAADKLLIASCHPQGQDRFLNTLRTPAAASSSMLYLALVPHPADWDNADGAPQVWQMAEDEWVEIT